MSLEVGRLQACIFLVTDYFPVGPLEDGLRRLSQSRARWTGSASAHQAPTAESGRAGKPREASPRGAGARSAHADLCADEVRVRRGRPGLAFPALTQLFADSGSCVCSGGWTTASFRSPSSPGTQGRCPAVRRRDRPLLVSRGSQGACL